MNLFIDTNVYLSFYHLTNDDLEELHKLAVLVREKRINLLIPEQVIEEFRRNRENKIADSLKRLRLQKLNLQFPQICKDYEEYALLRQLQKEYENNHAALLKKIAEDVGNESLKADTTIQELFGLGRIIRTTDQLISRSRNRVDMGNPPGKKGSLGDAVNWEALLAETIEGEDLFFITDDHDFSSPLDENVFNAYLLEEWARKKRSALIFYTRLSLFFKDHYPEIELVSDYEKDSLIRDLAHSSSFAETHTVIASLSNYFDFSAAQVNDIIDATLSNTQVSWIIGDPDVEEFIRQVVSNYEEMIEPYKLSLIIDLLEKDRILKEKMNHILNKTIHEESNDTR